MKNKIICVYNNKEIFEKVVKSNNYIANCDLFTFDNSSDNISITKRYNSFINEYVLDTAGAADGCPTKKQGFWCVFCHQDFGIQEDIDKVLSKLNPDSLYGAVGVKIFKGFFWGKRGKERKFGLKNELKITFGKILQGQNNFNLKKHGHFSPFQISVDAIDCCCVIMHSSLINKFRINFDENLDFHMYAEELCFRLKKEHNIQTKIAQMNCYHLGKGNCGKDFISSADYLKQKFNVSSIPSTCYN